MRLDADVPGFESLPSLLRRVHGALADFGEHARPVLVVGHNGSLRVALALLGLTDLASVVATSLEHLRPIEADLPDLRPA